MEDFNIDFLLRTILYSRLLELNSNSTVIESALFLTKSSIFLAVCCLNKAKLIASKIVDFPAPFSPTITLIPFSKSIIVFSWDLKLTSFNFVKIILEPP